MVTYRFLGYGMTDENGIAKLDHDAQGNPITHSYTGTGAGELDIVASLDDNEHINDSSIQSEPYETLDCIAIDNATLSDHNDIWSNTVQSGVNFERKEEYTEFSISVTGNKYIPLNTPLNSDMVIEFDAYCSDDGAFSDFVNDSSRVGILSIIRVGTVNNWIPIKLVISNNTITAYNRDTSQSYQIATNVECNGFRWLNFGVTSRTFRFKNVKIYHI